MGLVEATGVDDPTVVTMVLVTMVVTLMATTDAVTDTTAVVTKDKTPMATTISVLLQTIKLVRRTINLVYVFRHLHSTLLCVLKVLSYFSRI